MNIKPKVIIDPHSTTTYNAITFYVNEYYKDYHIKALSYFIFMNLNKLSNLKEKKRVNIENDSNSYIILYIYEDYILYNYNNNEYGIVYLPKLETKLRKEIRRLRDKQGININKDILDRIDKLILNIKTKNQVKKFINSYFSSYTLRSKLGSTKRSSVIFTGKPGDGKTYLATLLCSFIGDYTSMGVLKDEGKIFEKGCKEMPHIVGLIDDMNIAHFSREENGVICSNILSEMDRPHCNRIFFMTTNEEIKRESIDHAFFRPGRIDSIINFERPTNETITEFFKDGFNRKVLKILKCDELPKGFLDILIERCKGKSFAQLNHLKDLLYSSFADTQDFKLADCEKQLLEVDEYLKQSEFSNDDDECFYEDW